MVYKLSFLDMEENKIMHHFFSPKGELSRFKYLQLGLILIALKHILDFFLLSQIYQNNFEMIAFQSRWFYILPHQAGIYDFYVHHLKQFVIHFVISLPFIYSVFIITIKRLRNLNLNPLFSILLIIPYLNISFFLLLSLWPGRENQQSSEQNFLDRFIPKEGFQVAVVATMIVIFLSILILWISTSIYKDYGIFLFIGLPLIQGILISLLMNYHQKTDLIQCIIVGLIGLLVTALIALSLALEGLICILMAAPIVAIPVLLGILIGFLLTRLLEDKNKVSIFIFFLLTSYLPLLHADNHFRGLAPIYPLKTSVNIQATKQEIWDELVAFSKIAPPDELLFKLGISYPTHAEIKGHGVGAIRYCVFSTGEFVEPIRVWNEPDLLRFSVDKQPIPMKELSFYTDIEVAHLNGYFQSVSGQFKLTKIDENTVNLEGTTWYYSKIWPQSYWKLWSDYILHKIHYRVLNHIKFQAELNHQRNL